MFNSVILTSTSTQRFSTLKNIHINSRTFSMNQRRCGTVFVNEQRRKDGIHIGIAYKTVQRDRLILR